MAIYQTVILLRRVIILYEENFIYILFSTIINSGI